MDTQEKQQQIMKLQYLQKHIEQISEKTGEINAQLLDINISKNALAQIRETKVGTSILTQVANGIFVKTKLDNNEKLIVNIGADTTVEKTVPQVIEMLADQEQKMQKHLEELEGMIEQYGSQAMQQISVLEKEE